MAASDVLLDPCSVQFPHNQSYLSEYTCCNCVKLESRLKEVLLELSTAQLINKLLYKELSAVSTNHASASNAFTEEEGYGGPTEFAAWTKVTSKHPYSVSKHRNSEVLQTLEPVSVSNRYSALSNLRESTPDKDEVFPRRYVNSTQIFTNYSKKKKDLRKSPKSTIKVLARPHEQQSSLKYLQTKNEPVNDSSDLQSRPIPTIINGEASLVKMNGISYINNDKLSTIQSCLRESSLEISINRNKFSNSIKHKVLLFGDYFKRMCS
jgi:hypothetical protein